MTRYDYLKYSPWDKFRLGALSLDGTDDSGLPVLKGAPINKYPRSYFDFTGQFDPPGQGKVVRLERLLMLFEAVSRLRDLAPPPAMPTKDENIPFVSFVPRDSTWAPYMRSRKASLTEERSSLEAELPRLSDDLDSKTVAREAAGTAADAARSALEAAMGVMSEARDAMDSRVSELSAAKEALDAAAGSLAEETETVTGPDGSVTHEPDPVKVKTLRSALDSALSTFNSTADAASSAIAVYNSARYAYSEKRSEYQAALALLQAAEEDIMCARSAKARKQAEIDHCSWMIDQAQSSLDAIMKWDDSVSELDFDGWYDEYAKLKSYGKSYKEANAEHNAQSDRFRDLKVAYSDASKELYSDMDAVYEVAVAYIDSLGAKMAELSSLIAASNNESDRLSSERGSAANRIGGYEYDKGDIDNERKSLRESYDTGSSDRGAYIAGMASLEVRERALDSSIESERDLMLELDGKLAIESLRRELYGMDIDQHAASSDLADRWMYTALNCSDPYREWMSSGPSGRPSVLDTLVDGNLRLYAIWQVGILIRQMTYSRSLYRRDITSDSYYGYLRSLLLGGSVSIPVPGDVTTTDYTGCWTDDGSSKTYTDEFGGDSAAETRAANKALADATADHLAELEAAVASSDPFGGYLKWSSLGSDRASAVGLASGNASASASFMSDVTPTAVNGLLLSKLRGMLDEKATAADLRRAMSSVSVDDYNLLLFGPFANGIDAVSPVRVDPTRTRYLVRTSPSQSRSAGSSDSVQQSSAGSSGLSIGSDFKLTREWLDDLYGAMSSFTILWRTYPTWPLGEPVYPRLYTTYANPPITVVTSGYTATTEHLLAGSKWTSVDVVDKNEGLEELPEWSESTHEGRQTDWIKEKGQWVAKVTESSSKSYANKTLSGGKAYAFVNLGDRFTRWFTPGSLVTAVSVEATATWDTESNTDPAPNSGGVRKSDSWKQSNTLHTVPKIEWAFCGVANEDDVNIIVADPDSPVTSNEKRREILANEDKIAILRADTDSDNSSSIARLSEINAAKEASLRKELGERAAEEAKLPGLKSEVDAMLAAIRSKEDAYRDASVRYDDTWSELQLAQEESDYAETVLDDLGAGLSTTSAVTSSYARSDIYTDSWKSGRDSAKSSIASLKSRISDLTSSIRDASMKLIKARYDGSLGEDRLIARLADAAPGEESESVRAELRAFRSDLAYRLSSMRGRIRVDSYQRRSAENSLDSAVAELSEYERLLRYSAYVKSEMDVLDSQVTSAYEAVYDDTDGTLYVSKRLKSELDSMTDDQEYKSKVGDLSTLYGRLDGYVRGDRISRPYAVFSVDIDKFNLLKAEAKVDTDDPAYKDEYRKDYSASCEIKEHWAMAWLSFTRNTTNWTAPTGESMLPSEERALELATIERARTEAWEERSAKAESDRVRSYDARYSAFEDGFAARQKDYVDNENAISQAESDAHVADLEDRASRDTAEIRELAEYELSLWSSQDHVAD